MDPKRRWRSFLFLPFFLFLSVRLLLPSTADSCSYSHRFGLPETAFDFHIGWAAVGDRCWYPSSPRVDEAEKSAVKKEKKRKEKYIHIYRRIAHIVLVIVARIYSVTHAEMARTPFNLCSFVYLPSIQRPYMCIRPRSVYTSAPSTDNQWPVFLFFLLIFQAHGKSSRERGAAISLLSKQRMKTHLFLHVKAKKVDTQNDEYIDFV